jgi:hypothetical protein
MKQWLASILLCLLVVTFSCAQDSQQAAQASGNGVKISFPVTLEKGLESRKLKEGAPVVCVTAGALHGRNGFLIPSGSKVIGHVTQAQARAKGDSNSTLGIAFDKIEVKGKELAMTGTLQAIAPSLNYSGPTTGAAEPGSLNGGGRGDSGMSAGTTPGPTSSVKISGPANGTPLVNSSSTGVLGIKNMEMDANGLITSPGKQVKLDNGTQMMIRADIQMPVE